MSCLMMFMACYILVWLVFIFHVCPSKTIKKKPIIFVNSTEKLNFLKPTCKNKQSANENSKIQALSF